MAMTDTTKLFRSLADMGEDTVRLRLAQGAFAPAAKVKLVQHWLTEREKMSAQPSAISPQQTDRTKIETSKAWEAIESDYGFSKRTFGLRIRFVTESYKRQAIFRDVGQAYILALRPFKASSTTCRWRDRGNPAHLPPSQRH